MRRVRQIGRIRAARVRDEEGIQRVQIRSEALGFVMELGVIFHAFRTSIREVGFVVSVKVALVWMDACSRGIGRIGASSPFDDELPA
jgi:hypothetical protein